jgi:ureidoacrylate peracid hydrolase
MFKTLEEMVDPRHTALVVVDIQNAFIHSQGKMGRAGLNVSLMQEMVPRLQRFLDEARKVKDLTIIFLRGVYDEWTIAPQRASSTTRDALMLDDDWETDFYEVRPEPGERVIRKPRYGGFEGTELDLVLRGKGIQTLVMTGVGTNVCVETTAREGYQRNYHIAFVEDCTATTSVEDHEATLRNMRTYFGQVVSSKEVVEAWKARQSVAPLASVPAR